MKKIFKSVAIILSLLIILLVVKVFNAPMVLASKESVQKVSATTIATRTTQVNEIDNEEPIEEKIVYWDENIGKENLEDESIPGTTLGQYLISAGIDGYALAGLIGIEFNDTDTSNNIITDFEVQKDISKDKDESVIAGIKNNVLYIQYAGTLYFNESSVGIFAEDFPSIEYIRGFEYINTSEVKNMSHIFQNADSITSIDLTTFDTSKVRDMSYMFYDMTNLTTLNLNNLNTTNVTDMSYMFYNSKKISNLDVSSFNTSNVTNMSYMFYYLKNIRTLNLSSFNTSNVTDMSHMFDSMIKLETLDLKNFNTKQVVDMGFMFFGLQNLTNLNITSFDTSNVTNMEYMFEGMTKITTLDVSSFNTLNVNNMYAMFRAMTNIKTLDLSNFDTSSVTDMGSMFFMAENLIYVKIDNFNTSKVTNMSGMFQQTSLKSLDVSNFDTSNVTNMSQMFHASPIEELDVSSFDTSNVTNMFSMFGAMRKIESLDLSNFDTSNVTDMRYMFSGAVNLKHLDVSSFDTSNVTDMRYMFSNTALESLDLRNFKTDNVKNMIYMFSKMPNLKELDLSSFNLWQVGYGYGMPSFEETPNLQKLVVPTIKKGTLILNSTLYDENHQGYNELTQPQSGITLRAKHTVTYNGTNATKEILYGMPYGELPEIEQEDYIFLGWYKDSDFKEQVTFETLYNDIEDVTLYAKIVQEKYTVTFVDEDGTTILKEETAYDYGTPAKDISKPENPTKEATAEYTYTFTGWSPEISDVKKDVTYKATYSKVKNKYTVTWKNEDGTILEIDENVEYGTTPKYDGETPTKAKTAQYSYIFKNWDKEIEPVTGNVTYTAKFNSTVNKYKVTFVDEDGTTVLKEETEYEYGTLAKDIVRPTDPTKESTEEKTYAFAGWTPEVSDVTKDVVYKAVYSDIKNKYKVKFVDEDGTTILKDTVEYEYGTLAKNIVRPSNPTKEATAEYTYTFIGWTPEISDVKKDVTYKATYSKVKNKYTVTWKNEDGSVLEIDENVEYGTMPTYDGSTPTKAGTAQYSYIFKNWDKEVESVKGNVTYTAVFDSTVNKYTVTFVDEDGTTILKEETEYDYGTLASDIVLPEEPTKDKYNFDGWYTNNTFTDKYDFSGIVTEDIILYAHYTKKTELPLFDKIIGIIDLVKSIIKKIDVGTSIKELYNSITNEELVNIFDSKNNKIAEDQINNDEKLKTGYYLTYTNEDGEEVRLDISISGDVDGDGEISPMDYVKVKNHIMESSMISGNAYLNSADYNEDGEISPLDYVKIKNYIMNGDK